MKYLIEHHETFYYRRKLQYQNICISLKTQNKAEAKYIINIINSKIEVMRRNMDFYEELDYIKNIIKQYVDIAKDEYSELATRREQKYFHIKENGKKILGSHPVAIENAIENLTDDLFSDNKNIVAEKIVDDSNIKQEYKEALTKLSSEGKQRLRDEIIKAEIELLYYDKERNESRVKEDKLQQTYTSMQQKEKMTYSSAIDLIKEIDKQEKNKWRSKTKYQVKEEYIECVKDVKAHSIDKINLAIDTLLQSSEAEYLNDYTISDYERFFQALIYTPANVNQKKRLYLAYNENIVDIAEDFKNDIDNGDEKMSEDFSYELKLQSATNVSEKIKNLNDFLNDCIINDFLEKNYVQSNQKFSKKRYEKILKSASKRKPFNSQEVAAMFELMNQELEIFDFNAEMFYIPLIGLYQGMRVEEICKLKPADIKLVDNVFSIDINGDVKTDNSVRIIPVHKDLIDKFNFLDYVASRNNKDLLFTLSALNATSRKKVKYSHYFLRDFSKMRDNFVSEERIENDLISFHSFRHFFITRLRKSGVKFQDISRLAGHKVDTILKMLDETDGAGERSETQRYINDEELKESEHAYLREQINRLHLEDLQDDIKKLESRFKSLANFLKSS